MFHPCDRTPARLRRGFDLIMLVGAVACLLSVEMAAAEDWPSFQHDTKRSAVTSEQLDAEKLGQAWVWQSPYPPQPAWAGPAKWDAYAGIKGLRSMRNYDPAFHPVVVGQRVYFGSSVDDSVHCLDLQTGRELWTFTTDAPVRVAPTYWKENLYFGSDDGFAYCISAQDGTLVWKFRPVKPDRLILNNQRLIPLWPCRTGVTIFGETAYCAMALLPWEPAYLCALDPVNGQPIGQGRYVKKFRGVTMEGPLAAVGDLLVVPQGRVPPQLFRRSDGTVLGTLRGGGGSFVVVTEQDLIFHGPGNKTGWITGSDASDPGKVRQIATHANAHSMVVSAGTSYIATDRQLMAAVLSGKTRLWVANNDHYLAMVLAGETLFLGGQDSVAAVRASDGKQIWSHPVQGKAFGLAVANGRLIVSTDNGHIYSFAAQETQTQQADNTQARDSSSAQVAQAAEGQAAEGQAAEDAQSAVVPPFEDEGLIGRWVFSNAGVQGSTVKDQAGHQDAALISDIRGQSQADPRWVAQDDQKLVKFDGRTSALVQMKHTEGQYPRKEMTVESWVRIDQPVEWGGIMAIAQDNGSYERGWVLGYRQKKFSLALNAEGGPNRLDPYMTAPEEYEVGRWYHVAATFDGKTMILWVNGENVASRTDQTGKLNYPPHAPISIGAYHDDNEYFPLTGLLSEVRLYKRVLTSEELKAHAAEMPGPAGELASPQQNTPAVGPHLQFVSRSSAVVKWQTKENAPSKLTLWLGETSRIFEDKTPKTEHSITLTDLELDRQYSYQVALPRETDSPQQEEFVYSPSYECDTFFNYTIPQGQPAGQDRAEVGRAEVGRAEVGRAEVGRAVRRDVTQILKRVGLDRGICLVLGCQDGRLACELARQSQFHVIAVDTSPTRIQKVRLQAQAAGLYGIRVAVHQVENYADPILPQCFANLVISERFPESSPLPPEVTAKAVQKLLAPGRGLALLGSVASNPTDLGAERLTKWLAGQRDIGQIEPQSGVWAVLGRPRLPGAGEWSHLYGKGDNSAFGGEALAGVSRREDLAVQWIGRPGPRYQPDRNGRKPSPLSTNGRLFLQGLQRMIALDAFNGSLLWSIELPYLQRFNMPRDCSNWCADDDHVYAVLQDRLWVFDAATGEVVKIHPVISPQSPAAWQWDWGYVASNGPSLIGSAAKQGTSWTNFWGGSGSGWYDATGGEVTHKVCSDNLFCLDKQTGRQNWVYDKNSVIINSTVTSTPTAIYFVEGQAKELKEANNRRVGDAKLWESLNLVALDPSTGAELWRQPMETGSAEVVFFLAHGEGHLAAVASGKGQFHVQTFNDQTGKKSWESTFRWMKGDHGGHMSRPAIVDGSLYVRPQAFNLKTGEAQDVRLPGGGCGTYACTENALFFRAGNVTVWNRQNAEVTSWNRLRPDCWLSTIPAGGMLLSPEGGGGCSCGSWMETSIGFVPKKILNDQNSSK